MGEEDRSDGDDRLDAIVVEEVADQIAERMGERNQFPERHAQLPKADGEPGLARRQLAGSAARLEPRKRDQREAAHQYPRGGAVVVSG